MIELLKIGLPNDVRPNIIWRFVSYVDQNIYIQNGYYASPRHLVEEIQKSINFRYGPTLKNSNATITISYGENSARVKLDVQDPTKVQIIFPKAIAEILGVDRNYFDKPVGNEKYIFRYGVDLNTKFTNFTFTLI